MMQHIMAYLRKVDRSPYWIGVFRDKWGKQIFRSTKIPYSGSTTKERTQLKKKALQVAEGYERIVRGELKRQEDVRRIALELAALVGEEEAEIVSLRKFLNDWIDRIERSGLSDGTVESYKGTVRKFLEFMGDRAEHSVDLLKPIDVQKFINSLADKDGLSSKTIVKHLKSLRTPFKEAVDLQILSFNPTSGVKAPTVISATKDAFTVEEVKSILDACKGFKNGDEWRTAILLGYYNALRLGDATCMTWDKIKIEEGKIVFTPEKKKSQVEIPIHSAMISYLATLPTSDDPKEPLCPVLSQVPKGRRGPLSNSFKKIMLRAGIKIEQKGNGIRKVSNKSFHSLRHTLSTHLANANVSPEVRMKLTDHEDKRVHAGYTHHEFELLRDALNSIGGLDQ